MYAQEVGVKPYNVINLRKKTINAFFFFLINRMH